MTITMTAEKGLDHLLEDQEAFPPISLAQTDAEAARMTRVDRKYLVPAADVEHLLASLTGRARVLTIQGRRTFTYTSTYFDTAEDGLGSSHHAAATGRRRRFKVRTRCYVDTGTHMLEVKTRTGRGESRKERMPLTAALAAPNVFAESDTTGLAAREFVEERLSGISPGGSASSLRPVLTTEYRRRTLVLAEEGSRLTLDTDLLWSHPWASHGLRTCDLVVVETKSGQAPGAADRLLWRAGHRPIRLSKFATGLALLDPTEGTVRANRWHRTLAALRSDVELVALSTGARPTGDPVMEGGPPMTAPRPVEST